MGYTIIEAPHFGPDRVVGSTKFLNYIIQESDGRKYKIIRNCGPILKHENRECFFNPHMARLFADASECRDRGLPMPPSYGDYGVDFYGAQPLHIKVEIIPPPLPHLLEVQQLQAQMIGIASQISSSDATNSQPNAQNEDLWRQIAVLQEQMSRILSAIDQ